MFEALKAAAREYARVCGLKLQEYRKEAVRKYARTHDSEGHRKQPKRSK